MADIHIRDARTADIPALAALGEQTFAGTFRHLYSAKNLQTFLTEFHSEAFYARVLQDPEQRVFVVDDGGTLAGYILLKPDSLPCDPPRVDALEISRLYLLDTHRSKGLGSRLMGAALDYAQAKNFSEITLSVYSENYGAHRFYERYGFSKIGEYGFVVGDHVDAEWIMLKAL